MTTRNLLSRLNLILLSLRSALQSRTGLLLENLALRQQLAESARHPFVVAALRRRPLDDRFATAEAAEPPSMAAAKWPACRGGDEAAVVRLGTESWQPPPEPLGC